MERVFIGSYPWDSGERKYYCPVYKDLAAAIVLQAVRDYIKVIRKMWKPKLSVGVKRATILELTELEGFFYSSWYDTLCDVDPEKLIYNCHLRAEEQERKSISMQNRKRMNSLLKEASEKE